MEVQCVEIRRLRNAEIQVSHFESFQRFFHLARIYPTRSGKGRAAMRSCYLGYSAGKATYGRYYTKNQAEKTNQLLCTMQREVFTRLETAVHQLSQQLGFGNFRVIVEQDFNSNGFFGKIFFSGLGDQPSYVVSNAL